MCLLIVLSSSSYSYDYEDDNIQQRDIEWSELTPDNAFYVDDLITLEEYKSIVNEMNEINIEYWKKRDHGILEK